MLKMALTDILNKIKEDAESEAQRISREADFEIEKIIKEGSLALKNKKERIIEQARSKIAKSLLNARIDLEREAKEAILQKKYQILDEIFSDVLKSLEKMDKKAYRQWLSKSFKEMPKSAEGSVYAAKKREEETRDFFSDKKIPVAGIIESSGGFKFSAQDFEIDCTFESLIQKARQENEMEIINQLFAQ